ncbi:phage upper tail fiber protein [Modestobacter sp. VKM Ac-2985]|uniref:phage upper tail fiber protein n=1 Tax=Modestobacter sp. VKM Ac-2985 TaxID=3004139 RepID=UPI0022ABBE43|nr:hypothetical protein [Modestobacter sp. VKM Ac-2985]MCZ2837127.1 hypothetical protein [Modestobacter sp. VKM Ac-2985]
MPDFTFSPSAVLVESTGDFAIGATGVLRVVAGGATVPVYDLNGSALPNIVVGPKGAHQAFKADIPDGILDFGSVLLPAVSNESLTAAIDAQQAAQAAQSAAESAAAASLGKADANHTHGPTALQGSGTRNNTTFYRGDGVWAVPPSALGGGNVIGDGILNIRKISQANYDALATKDAATLYVIQG